MSDETVFSAAGVWPLLAFLSDGAAGAARSQLGEALGPPARRAAGAARELLDGLAGVRGLDSALGLWTWRTVELRSDWAAGLPAGTHGVLTGDEGTDRRTLDAWAAKHTGGQIDRMPVTLQPNTALVLATALALRTDWEVPFKGDLVPWRGDDRAGLTRTTPRSHSVAVAVELPEREPQYETLRVHATLDRPFGFLGSTATPGSSSRRAGSPTRSPSARTTSKGPARTAAPTNRYARCPARRCRSPGASTHRSRPPRRH